MKPKILLVSLSNDIGLERLAAEVVRHGGVCAVLCPPGFYSTKTRFVSRHFPLPRHFGMWLGMLFVRRRLERVVRLWSPDIVVPLDDVAGWLLRRIAVGHAATSELRRLLEKSFGDPAGYQAACRRLALMKMASRLGVRVPRYHGADTPSAALKAAGGMGYPVVLKSEYSCGGHGVVIPTGPEQLAQDMKSASSLGRSVLSRSRTAAKHLVWRLAGMSGTRDLPPILQAFVPGTPAMYTVATWKGRVLDGVGFVAERTHPETTGTSTVVRHVEHEDMQLAARLLVKELGCSGFVSFDFILDPTGDHAYLIEMNPRAIGTGHLGRAYGHDLYGAMVGALGGDPAASGNTAAARDRTIALFPKELGRDPDSLRWLFADDVIHDVPFDDPPLMAAYMGWLADAHPTQIGTIRRALGHAPARGKGVEHGVAAGNAA